MRKTLAVALTTALLSVSLSIPATAALKAGSRCATKGQVKQSQSKKFTCIKSGKNLVWSKGIIVNDLNASSNPKASASETPSPSQVTISLSPLPKNFGDIKPPQFLSGIASPQEIDLRLSQGQIKLTVVMRDDLNSIQPFFFGLRRVDMANSFVGNAIFRTSNSKLVAQTSDSSGVTETFELFLDLPKGLAPGTYWLEGGIRDYAENLSNSENNPGKTSFFPLLVVK